MDQLKQVLTTIQKNLGKLTVSHKLLIASLAVILLMTLFLVSQYAGSPKMVEILAGASADAQQKAAAYLAASGFEHESREGKILVPAEKQFTIMAALAEAGRLPDDSSVTFRNMIMQQNWMNPKSLNDQIYNTALENTLAQCLRNFKGISDATVVIDAPPPAGLGASARKPSASVIVFTKGGGPLDNATVNAIAATVAGAKAGLDVTRVNITDGTTGRHYTAQTDRDFAASSYMEHVAKYEDYVRNKLASHLAYIRGVSVAVNAQVDVRRTESRSRTIKPKGAGSETLTSREITSTVESTQGGDSAAPGLQSNVRMSIDQGGSGGGSDSQETTETEYSTRFGEVEEAIVDPRGMATKINAAIGVPRDYVVALWQQANPGSTGSPTDADLKPVFDAEKSRLEADLAPLIETDPRVADADGGAVQGTVVVSMIPVPVPGAAGVGGFGGGQGETGKAGLLGSFSSLAMSGWIKTVALGALALVSLAMMLLMVRKASKPAPMPSAEELVGLPPALATNNDLIGEADEGDTAMLGIEVDDQTLKTQRMIEEVSEMVKTRPTDAAALLQRWVTTED